MIRGSIGRKLRLPTIAGLLGWLVLGCSPGRIVQEAGEAADESGEVADESGDAATGQDGLSESGDGDDDAEDADEEGGGCGFLDICPPSDPCDSAFCAGACIGGVCVEPATRASCEGVELIELDPGVEFDGGYGPPTLTDLDGLAGDELVSADEGVVEALVAGQRVTSDVLPPGFVGEIHALQLDDDGLGDLLVHSAYSDSPYSILLLGDGAGGFVPSASSLPTEGAGFPIDVDHDGDHDILATSQSGTQLDYYLNQGGWLAVLESFDLPSRHAIATDFDLDGFVDDALLGNYQTSPAVLLGEDGLLVVQPSLPEAPDRPSEIEYHLSRPTVGDLDGDGLLEVVCPIADNWGRLGLRIWWGGPNGFEDPRDQMLFEANDDLSQLQIVELDGVAPAELVLTVGSEVFYARPDLANELPIACMSTLHANLLVRHVSFGDLEPDGQFELALRSNGLRLFTVTSP